MAEHGCPKKASQEMLPCSVEAAALYSQLLGSSLTAYTPFGADPFLTEYNKLTAENQFAEQYPDISVLFSSAVNNEFAPFKEALLCLVDTTRHNV